VQGNPPATLSPDNVVFFCTESMLQWRRTELKPAVGVVQVAAARHATQPR
jgi:hypothetical protein